MDFYTIPLKTIEGQDITLAEKREEVLLIVNTASKCGFTGQYAELEELYQLYRQRGFWVLGFPCNQFAGQEPGDETTIQAFCQTRYGVTFPLFQKILVNGPDTHPLFAELKQRAPGLLGSTGIKWNFTKFLVGPNASEVQRFAPTTSPKSLQKEIERLLPQ